MAKLKTSPRNSLNLKRNSKKRSWCLPLLPVDILLLSKRLSPLIYLLIWRYFLVSHCKREGFQCRSKMEVYSNAVEHQLHSPSLSFLTVQRRGLSQRQRRGDEMSPLATTRSWHMDEEREEFFPPSGLTAKFPDWFMSPCSKASDSTTSLWL